NPHRPATDGFDGVRGWLGAQQRASDYCNLFGVLDPGDHHPGGYSRPIGESRVVAQRELEVPEGGPTLVEIAPLDGQAWTERSVHPLVDNRLVRERVHRADSLAAAGVVTDDRRGREADAQHRL